MQPFALNYARPAVELEATTPSVQGRGPPGEHRRAAVGLGAQAGGCGRAGGPALRMADRGVRPGALRHAARLGRPLDEPPRRGPPGPAQAVAAAARPALRTARAGHVD